MTIRYDDILCRLREAKWPDQALDLAIRELFGLHWDYAADWGKGMANKPIAFPYTASIDTALALVQKMLPEVNACGIEIIQPRAHPDGLRWSAYVSKNYCHSGHWTKEAEAPTAPLAILIALFEALKAKEEDNA